MSVNASAILNNSEQTYEASYNQRDLMLYAAGIGETDLQFTYEFHDNFAAFPLYPVVLGFKGTSHDVVPFPPPTMASFPEGFPPVNPANMLHGEQSLELFRPLDPNGATLQCKGKVISFYDKGSGTLMESETLVSDDKGPVARLISGSFIRGLSGFEGKGRKLPPRVKIPQREPDLREVSKTLPSQAQIYRLSGDYNSLHVDPEIAQSVGFKVPILHGLCTMGFATRALFKHFCKGDPSRFKSVRVRFSSPTFPGETLETQMWVQGTTVFFRTIVQERQKVVIDGGEFVFHDEVPAKL
ncbi:hypothetical protein Poli38472_010233 [Pythium oligandrum]|uniref:MaoC-like domain-containing protein n=1 Tax=Pythium oligandrum TaxID=41045 RepID=A0A8K1C8K2_PYTOL|nr:hypothetical protein Poli38472_010233 [Pythium oligandrum]|eukprot:TMW58674.1 hypothetical protein Poli38472_010233 [Pythium oligandrum]